MRLFGRKIDQSQSLGKKCQILSNFVSEDFVAGNNRIDSELCITRAGKFGLLKNFDINQRKKVQRHHFGRIKAREGKGMGRSFVLDKVTL